MRMIGVTVCMFRKVWWQAGWSLLIIAVMSIASHPAEASDSEQCYDLVVDASERANWQIGVAALMRLASQCGTHPYWLYSLGKAFLREDRISEAKESFDSALLSPGRYEKELRLALGDVALRNHEYDKAETHYRDVIRRYPDWHIAYEYLGLLMLLTERLEESKSVFEQANRIRESAKAYRSLTLVYYLLEDYEQAIDALNRGYSLDVNLLGDRDFMIAGVRAYTEVGKFTIARNLLAIMLRENPAIKTDEEYLRAGFYLRKKMAETLGASQ